MNEHLLLTVNDFGAVLKNSFPSSKSGTIGKYRQALFDTIKRYDISTVLRLSHFLAQIGHESGELKYSEELASGAAYEWRKDLGNTQKGDGKLFKGRGLIQLTGRDNYEKYAGSLRGPLQGAYEAEGARAVATDPSLAADVAGWFWMTKGLSDLADQDNILAVTRKVNGGYNGIEDRRRLLALAKGAVSSANTLNLQHLLNEAGGYGLLYDGKLGPRTRSALRDAQHTMGLEPTGLLDKTTALKLMQEADL